MLLLWSWLVASNLLGFGGTLWDKRQARRQRQRVPERVFHTASLLGAWPGILLGMLMARHKTRKVRFLLWMAAAALLNIALLGAIWLAGSPDLS